MCYHCIGCVSLFVSEMYTSFCFVATRVAPNPAPSFTRPRQPREHVHGHTSSRVRIEMTSLLLRVQRNACMFNGTLVKTRPCLCFIDYSLLATLYIYIYIYIYIHTYIHTYIYTHMYVYIYIYIYTHTHICIHRYVYIYTYIERERDRERERCIHTCIYMHYIIE